MSLLVHKRGFIIPGPGDSRSPCPGLNTLANEGFLPHDGKGISLALLNQTLEEGYNLDVSLRNFLVSGTAVLVNNDTGTFDLHDLAKHNLIEHDASLVHDDTPSGEVYAPVDTNQTKVAGVIALSSNGRVLSEHDFAVAGVEAEKLSDDLTPEGLDRSDGEAALSLTVLGHPTVDGSAYELELNTFASIIGQNRLPEGFVKSASPVTLVNVATVKGRVAAYKKELRSDSA
ncbi:Cloroperoxidase [Exidia glandulosa HHB12029]|uniref:Cloroperoxidase n=1 Tax=Exidia glandulosa HHB12029 TaxID=1314781 RepID=A0A165FSW8_EXIGL|nr:Cloroperoxidase [Exidia glandulosa HHB12029]